jgi:dTDP-4-dehydrorhamnose 3,5-epimerase
MDIRPSVVIDGVHHLTLDQQFDGRGYFIETYRASWLPAAKFEQWNTSKSQAGVLRGLHYHLGQEDLWFIPSGTALVTLVDLRASSPTYKAAEQFELAGPTAAHIPIGVAHGFYAPVETLMLYMVTAYYDGTDELGVRWNDPDLGIEWPVEAPILSERDQQAPKWADIPVELRPS